MLLAAALPSASTQDVSQDADPPAAPRRRSDTVFRSGAELVVLPVTVTDSRQKYVTGLTRTDFHVYEDGALQDLAFFLADPAPIDLAILLDTSVSMSSKMAMAREAALGFVRTLRAGDRAAVVEFNDAVHVRHPLTEDLAPVESAIREANAGGGTALYTALYIALKELARQNPTTGEVRRQAIVLLSDGEDSRSLVTSDQVLELVRRSGIVVYSISLRSASAGPRGRATPDRTSHSRSWYDSPSDYLMRTLADASGGRAFFPGELRELGPVYGVIAEELASQYTLGYSPKNPGPDGAFRHLAVRLPSQPGAHARTRQGYLAPGVRPHADKGR